jgi:hypothetical protein
MADYDNTNRGSIWKNDKKETENHPDFTGSLNVNGQEFWVSAWKRKPDASEKAPALSFSIKPKEDSVKKPTTATSSNNVATQRQDMQSNDPMNFDDDIPF